FSRWAFHHVRELLPTADIVHDPAMVRRLPRSSVGFAETRVIDEERVLTLDQALATTSTDALVVLHKGAVALERYFNGMTERSPHILMSISKSTRWARQRAPT